MRRTTSDAPDQAPSKVKEAGWTQTERGAVEEGKETDVRGRLESAGRREAEHSAEHVVGRAGRLHIAKLLGDLLNPYVIGLSLFAMVVFAKAALPEAALYLAMVVAGAGCMAGHLYWQLRRGLVSGFWLPVRRERYATAVGTILVSTAVISLFAVIGVPREIMMLAVASLVAAVIFSAVTLAWKISAHAATAGYAAAAALLLLGGWGALFVPLVPVVAWARIAHGVHTIRQVIVGSLLGAAVAAVLLAF